MGDCKDGLNFTATQQIGQCSPDLWDDLRLIAGQLNSNMSWSLHIFMFLCQTLVISFKYLYNSFL